MCLYSFDQTFETDTATCSGVYQISISGCPGTETGIEQRLQRPTVVRPTQITVQMLLWRIETHPGSFGRVGESKRIGVCFRAASIIGSALILGFTAETYIFGIVLTDHNAIIIQIRLNFRMIISSQWNFKIRISLTNHFQSLLHYIHWALIHSNRTNIKPAFFFEVFCKRSKHCHPHFFISLFARCGLHKFQRVRSLVVILERQFPGNHWITVYLLVNADTHHKFHPTVKNGIVKRPRTVCTFYPSYHCVEIIFRLPVPGFMSQSSRNNLLPGICQHFHQRAHSVQMLLAP